MKLNNKNSINGNRGQAMLLTVLVLGGSILAASTIAGYLMLLKIRESSDITNSTRAIYAADTGVEWELYKYFKNDGYAKPTFSNGASFNATEEQTIKVVGQAGNAFRAFEISFGTGTSTSP
jgi:hypothetical protein